MKYILKMYNILPRKDDSVLISTWIEHLKDIWAERGRLLKEGVGIRLVYMGILVGLPMLFAIGYVGWQRLSDSPPNHSQVLSASSVADRDSSDESTSEGQPQQNSDSDGEQTSIIWVDVSGAVRTPGLKQMSSGDRVSLALDLAGGYADDADQVYVSQVLNLAQLLEDGDKIYIPTKSQVLAAMPTPVPLHGQDGITPLNLLSSSPHQAVLVSSSKKLDENGGGDGRDANSTGVVMVNEATESELLRLPGVGPATAKKIIEGRPYQDHQSLCQVVNNSRTCAGLVELIGF